MTTEFMNYYCDLCFREWLRTIEIVPSATPASYWSSYIRGSKYLKLVVRIYSLNGTVYLCPDHISQLAYDSVKELQKTIEVLRQDLDGYVIVKKADIR